MDNSAETPPKKQAWDRLKDESDLQYMAFVCYLEIDQPNIEEAYRSYYQRRFPERWNEAVASGTESTIKASGSFSEWSKVHHWKERREAYYDDLYETVLKELKQRQIKALIAHADMGRLLREKALEALMAISATTQFVAVNEEDGREIWILATKLKPADIARLAELGVAIENRVFGNPDSIQKHEHSVDPETLQDIDKLAENIKKRSEGYTNAYKQMEKNLEELGFYGSHSKN